MRYYALYDDNNKLIAIGTGAGGVEITEAEYNALLTEIKAKAQLVEDVYSGKTTLADVPTEWQTEVENRVNQLIKDNAITDAEISAEEALEIILGGETT